MNESGHQLFPKEYPHHDRKIEEAENKSHEKSLVVVQKNSSKELIKYLQRFSQISVNAPNKSYILNVRKKKYIRYSKLNSKTWTVEIESSYYSKPQNIENLDSQQVLSDFFKIFELFKYFEVKETPFINILARNLQCVIIDKKTELKICPFTKRYLVSQHLTLDILSEDRYHRLLPRGASNELKFNYNKIAVFILGLKLIEFVTKKKIAKKDTIQSINNREFDDQLGMWKTIFEYMLEEDETKRLDFTQLLLLEICNICQNTLKLQTRSCPNCKCSICGIRDKRQVDFCNKNLCIQCLNSGKYCLNCEHFSFLPIEDLYNDSEVINSFCLCGKNWILTEKYLMCDCGEYCKICKLKSHAPPCYKNMQTEHIMCKCKQVATRRANTFYFFCNECNQDYCFVCYKPVVDISHYNCIRLIMDLKET